MYHNTIVFYLKPAPSREPGIVMDVHLTACQYMLFHVSTKSYPFSLDKIQIFFEAEGER